MADPEHDFVSRGGLKLDAALDQFGLDATGLTAADLGCSTGGFVDCLLQRGATHVFAVDTAYGELAWKLRQDQRVTVMERTNALHRDPPPKVSEAGGVDLVSVDLGWTKQDRAVPVALSWLRPTGHVLTLIKPHYEAGQHRMTDAEAEAEARRVADEVLPGLGVTVRGLAASPIRGGKGKNIEYIAWLTPTSGV